MPNSITSDATNSAKSLAQQIAKQMAREPAEILEDIKEQTTGRELSRQLDSETSGHEPDQQKKLQEQQAAQDNMKSSRLIEALKREIEDIQKQKLFKDLQDRIMNGEEVPLEDYPELSMDQKQVLKAQMEAVKQGMINDKYANDKSFGVPSVHSKPSRRFGAGQKQAAQKEQTRVEKPVPPSG